MPRRIRQTRRPIQAITGVEVATTLISRAAALRAIGEVVYAVRVGDVVKIGRTTNLSLRMQALRADEILAFRPGTYADEQAIHAQLVAHRHHGREWYYPTPGVYAVVNEMRAVLGMDPLAA